MSATAQTDTRPPRPRPLLVAAENIPAELKQLNQWVLWQYELIKDNEWTKVPCQVNGRNASTTDSKTWTDFSRALAAYQLGRVKFDGIGLACTVESGIVGVDLDHCVDHNGRKLEPWAIEIIRALYSYTEFSPSGSGVRVWVKGNLPQGRRHKGDVEMYVMGRYLTLTGHILKNFPRTIERRDDKIAEVHRKFLADKPEPKPKPNPGNGAWHPSDDELLDKAFGAKNGDKLKALYHGDVGGYPSQSEADLALCSMLAFWAADEAQLDRLFRRSGLMRDKWDEKHGAVTYGEGTIEKAFANRTERYEGHTGSNGNGSNEKSDPGPYTVNGGCICKIRYDDKGNATHEPLCNFDAKVTEEILLDDGAEVTRAFIINGRLADGKIFPSCRIPASRFAGMSWVTEQWGLRAVVNAGNAKRDALREAIQRLSPDPRLRRIYTHTGWREIDDKWIYLSGKTAGAGDFEVDLGSELSRYKLPPVASDPVGAMKLSLRLLDLAPLRITAPLWAACYRAPLVSAFPQDLSLWIEGPTGSMKTTITALFLSHFGDFDRIHLPGAWSSTGNQLERRAFLLKDSLFVIDDYAPAALDHRELETKAARLLRSQGNLAGRGRLKADLSERPAFAPRGIILSTGEQHPPGQSLLARTLVIELDRMDIDIKSLTQIQEQSARLAHAMAGYIAWLAPQMADMPRLLRETFRGARTKATGGREHLRIPEAAAHLWLGLHCGTVYAEEIGALTATEAEDLREKCWLAFLEIGREQGRIVEEEKPTRRFLGVLYTIIVQGRAVLLPKDESPTEPKPGVDFVGWRDDDFLYLLPEATFSAVVRFCRDTGEHFPTRQERLKRDLAKEGISECEPGRFTNNLWVGDRTRRILKLAISKIKALLGEDIPTIPTHSQSSHFWKGERDGL